MARGAKPPEDEAGGAPQEEALLPLGRVARAHGIRGRVLIVPWNEESQGGERVTRLWLQRDGQSRMYEVARAERANLGYLVAFHGIDDRDAAEALKGSEVLADRAELPPLEAGEFYAADLVGLAVVDAQGRERGVIEEVESAGPQDLLRLRGGTLVPLSFVREVRLEDKQVLVDAPAGLFDLDGE